jgi:hypothetical protein
MYIKVTAKVFFLFSFFFIVSFFFFAPFFYFFGAPSLFERDFYYGCDFSRCRSASRFFGRGTVAIEFVGPYSK